jgi:hypothetical protein
MDVLTRNEGTQVRLESRVNEIGTLHMSIHGESNLTCVLVRFVFSTLCVNHTPKSGRHVTLLCRGHE